MGIYLNPGYESFEEALNSESYVDKTEMVLYTNAVLKTKQKYLCVSRPRRFGKTMAADLLCAYYGKGKSGEVFADTKLVAHDGWDRYLNQFDVIRIVMTDFIKERVEVEKSLSKMQKLVVRDIKNNIRRLIILIQMIWFSPWKMCIQKRAKHLL